MTPHRFCALLSVYADCLAAETKGRATPSVMRLRALGAALETAGGPSVAQACDRLTAAAEHPPAAVGAEDGAAPMAGLAALLRAAGAAGPAADVEAAHAVWSALPDVAALEEAAEAAVARRAVSPQEALFEARAADLRAAAADPEALAALKSNMAKDKRLARAALRRISALCGVAAPPDPKASRKMILDALCTRIAEGRVRPENAGGSVAETVTAVLDAVIAPERRAAAEPIAAQLRAAAEPAPKSVPDPSEEAVLLAASGARGPLRLRQAALSPLAPPAHSEIATAPLESAMAARQPVAAAANIAPAAAADAANPELEALEPEVISFGADPLETTEAAPPVPPTGSDPAPTGERGGGAEASGPSLEAGAPSAEAGPCAADARTRASALAFLARYSRADQTDL